MDKDIIIIDPCTRHYWNENRIFEMEDDIDIGFRVKVPFGIKNRPTEGFVYSLVNEEEAENIKNERTTLNANS